MKQRVRHGNFALVAAISLLLSQSSSDRASASPKIDAVFFAQTHVQPPDSPYFKLVGNREALLKVHVVSPAREAAPPVSALLTLDGARTNLVLRGPATLPESIPIEPGVVQHRFDNSFTVMMPKEWIRRGLKIAVTAGEEQATFENLKIGAPAVIQMTMFDTHFFAYEERDYMKGWRNELLAKWPVSDLKVQRVPNLVFKELVVPPRAGLPAVRCRQQEDYMAKTGHPFDGEQATALVWMRALHKAGGQRRVSLFYVNIYNVSAGGEAWDFGGVGRAGATTLMHHELGHTFNLPHWADDPNYPYQGPMHGISHRGGPNVGPIWGFDARIGLAGSEPGMPYFISPIVHAKATGGTPGEWKNDPMQGGMNDVDPGHILRMFSDYSAYKIQEYLENHMAVWNEELNGFATWDDETGSYGKVLENDGVSLPVERDVEVVTVLAGISALTPEANIVYPPIGPYTSGLVRLFDPSVPEDRARATQVFESEGGSDLCLRVTQGGKVRTYMLPIAWRPGEDPALPWNYTARAINLPVRDGKVTRAELLLTPGANANGLPADPKVLDAWELKAGEG